MQPELHVLTVSHLFPTEHYERSGVFLVREAELLREHGVQCAFLVPRPRVVWPLTMMSRWRVHAASNPLRPPAPFEARDVAYPRPPGFWFRRFEGAAMARALVPAALKWHRQRPFDLVWGIDLRADTTAAIAVAQALGRPVAGLAIGTDVMDNTAKHAMVRAQVAKNVKQLDLPIGVSAAACAQMEQLGPCKRAPLKVVLGRDEEMFHPPEDKQQAKTALGWGPNEVVAVYVGAFFSTKGMMELVAAARRLLARHEALRLVCVGTGALRSELEALRDESGNADRVRLPGRLAPEHVPPILRAADFLVLPSYSEGLPQVVLEGMNCGLAVVATDVGGTAEAVVDQQTGLLVPPRAVEPLEQAMERMIEDAEFRRACGQRGLLRVREEFDGRPHAARLAEALYALKDSTP